MAIPTTILNARVKQKIATDDYWISIEDELGVILAGEMALVYNDEGEAINFKVGDGLKKYSELPFFIAYFNNVTNCKVLSYVETIGNITINTTFKNKSTLSKIYLINNSGSEQTIKIGTTDGGSEIGEITIPNDIVSINIDYFFTSAQTVYITGLTDVNYSMFILYYQLDEQPVIPTGGGGTVTTKWVFGTLYPFYPMYAGHENNAFSFLTGYGKAGTDYEGAVLMGTNGLPDISGYLLKAYKDGDTIGGAVGSDSFTLVPANIPQMDIPLPNSSRPGRSDDANDRDVMIPTSQQYIRVGQASPDPVSIVPKSRIVLYFTGMPTT